MFYCRLPPRRPKRRRQLLIGQCRSVGRRESPLLPPSRRRRKISACRAYRKRVSYGQDGSAEREEAEEESKQEAAAEGKGGEAASQVIQGRGLSQEKERRRATKLLSPCRGLERQGKQARQRQVRRWNPKHGMACISAGRCQLSALGGRANVFGHHHQEQATHALAAAVPSS